MSIYEIPNMTGGVDQTMVEVVSTDPSFIVGLLFFIFFIIFLSGSASQRVRQGFVDFPMWSLMASLATFLTSLILSLEAGLINLETLGIVVALLILSALWFFLSRGRNEMD